MCSCNKSYAFKQSLCHVARRYIQKVKHIIEVVSPHALPKRIDLGTDANTGLGRGEPPLSPSHRFLMLSSS